MQGSKIISYSKDDFYLIKNSTFKKGEFIGKVKTIETSCANLSVFIFPEDTKDGRKEYMSTYEVFYTKNEIKYTFTGNEKKVFVLDFEEYIKKKYILKEKFTEDNIAFILICKRLAIAKNISIQIQHLKLVDAVIIFILLVI